MGLIELMNSSRRVNLEDRWLIVLILKIGQVFMSKQKRRWSLFNVYNYYEGTSII